MAEEDLTVPSYTLVLFFETQQTYHAFKSPRLNVQVITSPKEDGRSLSLAEHPKTANMNLVRA